jgi:diguanylate cyclase (GGDEF)-like protein
MSYLVHLYNNMGDSQRALATAEEALALARPEPRLLARLYYAKGIALLKLKRQDAALAAFRHGLALSRNAGLAVMEAFLLGNIADAELHAERWVQAERSARQAYALAQRTGDQGAAAIARANIGFALGGQGRIAEALPWIDGVIDLFRKGKAHNSLQEMLGEKGRMLERAGLAEQALAVVREQQRVLREIFTTERAHAVAALQEKFEAEQKRRRIDLLQRENQLKDADLRNRALRQTATTLAAVLTLVLGIFAYLLYRRAGKSNAALRILNAQLEHHAEHDALTGLHNRRSFVERMRRRAALADERRRPAAGAGDCLILLDIDHFKTVNDTWGHAAGDAVLVEVARRLQGVVRETDMVLRWGGEEFLVYSPGATGAQARALVERILAAVGEQPVAFEQHVIAVTTSAGFVVLPFGAVPEAVFGWERAVALADEALYLAKSGGRNRACGPLAPAGNPDSVLAALAPSLGEAVATALIGLLTVPGPRRTRQSAGCRT